MSEGDLVILGATSATVALGAIAGMTMKPHGPWKGVFEAAAAATGVVLALALLAPLVERIVGSGKHGDQDAPLILLVVLIFPAYVLALAGAVAGKSLGRVVRDRPSE